MSLVRPERIRTHKCAAAFSRIFGAFIFLLDLRVVSKNLAIDGLPDFVAWILIATAAGSIVSLHPDLRTVRNLAYWLVFLSLFDLVDFRMPVYEAGTVTVSANPFLPILLATNLLGIIVIWKLCGVIMDMASALGKARMRNRAAFRRNLYVVFIVALCLTETTHNALPDLGTVFAIVTLALAVPAFCLLMGLMRRTQKMCLAASGEPGVGLREAS